MEAKQPAYRALSQFALRTPTLPFDVLDRWSAQPDLAARREVLRALVDDPAVREAVFVASPDLERQIALWQREPDAPAAVAVERALVRYVSRMASRCTPFGLFASVAIAPLGADTRLDVPPRSAAWRRTRLDNDVLFALTTALGRDRAVRERVRYRANSSLYAAAARLRYAEARVAGALRSYQLVAVDPTDYLDALLARSAGDGATRAELLSVLTADPEVTADEAAAFLDEVIDTQLLVPVLGPHVTGPEPSEGLAQLLRAHDLVDPATVLDDARRAIAAIDGAAPGVPAEAYRAIEADLGRRLPIAFETSRLFQVDLYKPAGEASLGPAVTAELLKGAELLHRLTPNGGDDWSSFRGRFAARYETREVPLLEVLDDETGIGFGGAETNARAAPLIAGLAMPAPRGPQQALVRDRDRHLMFLVARALDARAAEIELSPADVDKLTEREPVRLADVISINAVLVAASPQAVETGDYRVRLGGIGMGAQLLGRFTHGSADARALVEQISRAEEAFHPDAVFAEIVHLPEGRLGNILLRPVLRGHEIPYLGTSGAPLDRQIEVSDLLVSIEGARVVLRSRRLGREVRPRMTTAHNFANSKSLAPYRFLCAHASQGTGYASWQWGVLDHLPFLPRVRHGRFVLARARWLLHDHELAPLEAAFAGLASAKTPAQITAIRARTAAVIARLREQLRLPRWVVIADGDNELAVDLDNELMVDSAAHLVKGRKTAVLQELLPGPGELCARGPEGGFVHELVVFAARPPEIRDARLPPPTAPVARRFLPGSEWLYLRVYTGSTTADPVLRGYLAPAIAAAIAAGPRPQLVLHPLRRPGLAPPRAVPRRPREPDRPAPADAPRGARPRDRGRPGVAGRARNLRARGRALRRRRGDRDRGGAVPHRQRVRAGHDRDPRGRRRRLRDLAARPAQHRPAARRPRALARRQARVRDPRARRLRQGVRDGHRAAALARRQVPRARQGDRGAARRAGRRTRPRPRRADRADRGALRGQPTARGPAAGARGRRPAAPARHRAGAQPRPHGREPDDALASAAPGAGAVRPPAPALRRPDRAREAAPGVKRRAPPRHALGITGQVRQAWIVTAAEIAPIDATHFAGVVPWLVSLWRKLRAAVEVHQATNEEQQVLHLIEYVTSAIGRPVLAASDADDLDDRLDSLVGSDALLASIQYLLAQHLTLFETAEPPSTTRVAAAVGDALGAAQARLLTEAQPMLDAWLSAQRQGIARYATEMSTWAERRRDLDLASPDVPAELAECMFHALRATVCIIAIAHAVIGEQRVEPWLARALTERFLESARQHLRMLASLPGVIVDDAIVPHTERLDLAAIEVRHRRARDVARRTLEAARLRSPS